MRRIKREVSGVQNIDAILKKTNICRLGLCDGDRPYVVPLHFAHEIRDGRFIVYCHSAKEGRKLDILARNPNVCFEADIPGEIIKKDSACECSSYYESVIGNGRAEIIEDNAEKIRALELLMACFGFEGKPEFRPAGLNATAVIRIELDEIAAKRHDENQ